MSCSTKGELYAAVNEFRNDEFINSPSDVIGECVRHDWAKIEKVDFKTKGLKGMSYLAANDYENNVIMLRSSLPNDEMNFVCGHEVIHVKFHQHYRIKTFSCFDKIKANQNSFLEWQANEGSAELIVPMQEFLPKIKEAFPHLKTWNDFHQFKFELAEHFNVTDAVITYRLESLKYELWQYLNGTPISKIKILSHTQQQARGIIVKSYNDVEDTLWQEEFGGYNIDIFA